MAYLDTKLNALIATRDSELADSSVIMLTKLTHGSQSAATKKVATRLKCLRTQ